MKAFDADVLTLIRVGISDLRIAAICTLHAATLISRNRKDFEQVPGLSVGFR
jgi:tRNA(fMet)-specific endonuclease VapC